MANIIQLSLFSEEKGELTQESFLDITKQLNNDVRRSLFNAFEKSQSLNVEYQLPRRVMSDIFHYLFFNELEKQITAEDVLFYGDSTGNEKVYFTKGEFAFVLCKQGVTLKDTSINSMIDNQSLNRHIIKIEYEISPTWDRIISSNMSYKGSGIEYIHSISMVEKMEINNTNISEEVTPKLKRTVAKKAE